MGNRKTQAKRPEPRRHLTRATADAFENFLDSLRREGYLVKKGSVEKFLREILPPPPPKPVDLRIWQKDPDSKYCTVSPPNPAITRGKDFVIANETTTDPVRVHFPTGVFRGADGQEDGMDYVDVPAGKKKTMTAIEVQSADRVEFILSCTDPGTGAGPKGVIQPPP
jgi:hypothetical protein